MSKTSHHLGVFAKYWEPGHVKTRLATAIGNENAARLYREFARQTLVRLGTSGQRRSLWIWPHERESEFRTLAGDSWEIRHQSDGNLGQRISTFFHSTLSGNSARHSPTHAVLVGTDAPTLDPQLIDDAFSTLDSCECVLGPSADGGYYLIGLTRHVPRLFKNIAWSSSRVLEQTRQRARELGMTYCELPWFNDVDESSDLQELARQLESLTHPSANDRELLSVIGQCSEQRR
ncbi:MAG: TIGR04282 family arsenosugar biosynthesis glycosyltransferase [Pirellulaceae bacterium]